MGSIRVVCRVLARGWVCPIEGDFETHMREGKKFL